MNVYRRDRTYRWNYEHGPSFRGRFPRVPATPPKEFLGFPVRSRIGIAAGILLNSRWIECYSRLGFDVLTYKTVRSAHRPCYPLPNWVYVDPPRAGGGGPFHVSARRPRDARAVTSAVCFGMPSMSPEVWRRDVRRARSKLRRGQILIVSVVGTPRDGGGREALLEDFVRCASEAAAAGAHAVELNYSCPNVSSAEGSVYHDPSFSRELSAAARSALRSTPFLIKAGHFGSDAALGGFLDAVRGKADAIVIVNGMSRRVIRRGGAPAFPGHETVGILGRALHEPAVRNVRAAAALAGRRAGGPAIIAVGGVITEDDAEDFFDAGAGAVLLGGGAALDPLFAARVKRTRPEW